jgi:hypothetical protein
MGVKPQPAEVSLARLQEPEEHDHLEAETRGGRGVDFPFVGNEELEELEHCLRGLGASPTVEAEELETVLMLRIFLGEALVDLEGGGLLEGCPVILLENGVSCFPVRRGYGHIEAAGSNYPRCGGFESRQPESRYSGEVVPSEEVPER